MAHVLSKIKQNRKKTGVIVGRLERAPAFTYIQSPLNILEKVMQSVGTLFYQQCVCVTCF